MASCVNIPVIDFDVYNLNKKVGNLESLRSLSDEICDAFSTVGLCYIKNHGLPQESIDRLQECTKDFFRLDMETKLQYQSAPEVYFGYRPLEGDRHNPERGPLDLTEGFIAKFGVTNLSWKTLYCNKTYPESFLSFAQVVDSGCLVVLLKWPTDFFPEMEGIYLDFSKLAGELSMRILNTIALSFSESDGQIIRQKHNAATKFGDPQCYCCVRSNSYPEIKTADIKKGQVRFGEHTDVGSVTLAFQDDVGGFEIKTRGGEFIPVNPIPGTVVVYLGDMMQRWTSDKLIAVEHRVVFPQEPETIGERQSLIAFFGPDLDAEIKCLDGTNKYEPITFGAYLAGKVEELKTYLNKQQTRKQHT